MPGSRSCATNCATPRTLLVGASGHSAAGRGAWVLYAEGKRYDALNAMSAAADAEEQDRKTSVTPGRAPAARELYASCCSIAQRPGRAAAFEATLKTKRTNLWCLCRLRQGRRKIGDRQGLEYSEKIVASAGGADKPGPRSRMRARRWRSAEGAREHQGSSSCEHCFANRVQRACCPAGAQSLQVIGYSGYLGEWELPKSRKRPPATSSNISGR